MAVDLEHPWIREGGEASDKPIDSAVLSRMKQFRTMNKLKQLALKVGYYILFHSKTSNNEMAMLYTHNQGLKSPLYLYDRCGRSVG